MPESFYPFLARPSSYPDESISGRYSVPYVDGVPDDLIKDTDLVENVLSFLDKLDLEGTAEITDVSTLRQELLSAKGVQQDIAEQVKKQTEGAGDAGADMGAEEEMDTGAV